MSWGVNSSVGGETGPLFLSSEPRTQITRDSRSEPAGLLKHVTEAKEGPLKIRRGKEKGKVPKGEEDGGIERLVHAFKRESPSKAF